jgi:hypothetical protein
MHWLLVAAALAYLGYQAPGLLGSAEAAAGELDHLGVLLGAGVAAGPAAATVLVYRGCSWLLPSAVGWINYGVQIHAIQPRPRQEPIHRAGRRWA